MALTQSVMQTQTKPPVQPETTHPDLPELYNTEYLELTDKANALEQKLRDGKEEQRRLDESMKQHEKNMETNNWLKEKIRRLCEENQQLMADNEQKRKDLARASQSMGDILEEVNAIKKSYEQKEKARVYHDVEDMYQHFELIGGNPKDKSLDNMTE